MDFKKHHLEQLVEELEDYIDAGRTGAQAFRYLCRKRAGFDKESRERLMQIYAIEPDDFEWCDDLLGHLEDLLEEWDDPDDGFGAALEDFEQRQTSVEGCLPVVLVVLVLPVALICGISILI